ncbi:MAG: ubiquinol-cytochrome c reductase iron-sulfur subunit [Burkholderiaceae bacterium]|jgi:ubiquinol-cytochrome c reductase iron-sulfur subunit|nr:ubiquinol-cytochrome c reductase iron-sulfur subunit [Burkholderiaceae bacterium]MEB2318995.1 ubiquinol-cytochrome c reductase iron-sulfur subunit [Pseudomonadota bacterium]
MSDPNKWATASGPDVPPGNAPQPASIRPVDQSRRGAIGATAALGAVGGIATAVPFVASFSPSERAKAAGAPVEVDIAGMKPGELKRVEWQGKPVWIIRRTEAMVDTLGGLDPQLADPASDRYYQIPTPEYARNEWRSIRKETLVVVGICPHLGCSPSDRFAPGAQPSLPDDWQGGFLCPCHGSTFDLAGRVFKNKPSPVNLDVPPHTYLSDSKLLIGEDKA